MKITVKIELEKYTNILTIDEEQDQDLFLKDYLEFLKTTLHAAGFSYIIDLAVLTQSDLIPATESTEYWLARARMLSKPLPKTLPGSKPRKTKA